MKSLGKKLLIMVTVFGLLIGSMSIPVKADAKNSYWLSGVSKVAGGNMKMYYKGNTISITGKVKKAASQEKVYDAAEKKCSYSLKVAPKCKVVLVEAGNVQIITYKKWAKENGYQPGDAVRCIEGTLNVKGKKIVRIQFSA